MSVFSASYFLYTNHNNNSPSRGGNGEEIPSVQEEKHPKTFMEKADCVDLREETDTFRMTSWRG